MPCYGINKENKCHVDVYTMEESKMIAYKPNLLVNGDFRCNQRGKILYENGTYTPQYTIDMWKVVAGKVNMSFENYLTLESYNVDGSCYFLQNFDSEKSGDFVISIKVLNINKGSFRIYFEGTNEQGYATIDKKGIYKITFRDIKNATGVTLALDNFSGDIEYIRLDEGLVPLPHMKEDYATALNRCKQYIQKLFISGVYRCNTTTSSEALFDVEEMKTTPTLSKDYVGDTLQIYHNGANGTTQKANVVLSFQQGKVLSKVTHSSFTVSTDKVSTVLAGGFAILTCEPA